MGLVREKQYVHSKFNELKKGFTWNEDFYGTTHKLRHKILTPLLNVKKKYFLLFRSVYSRCAPQKRAQLKGIGRRYGLPEIWMPSFLCDQKKVQFLFVVIRFGIGGGRHVSLHHRLGS